MPSPSLRVPLLLCGAFFGHVLYPVGVQLAARAVAPRPDDLEQDPDTERYVTAVVPAYGERTTVGPLIELLLHGPGSPVAEVVAVVDDDHATGEVARAAGAVVVEGDERWGKAGAVNRGVARAGHDVVLLLDANVTVDGATLRRLTDHVRDGRLDLVGGVRTEHGRTGESLYWTFENLAKTAEDRLGGSLALVGEMMALRRGLFQPIPEWVRVDDLFLGLDFASRRHRVSVDTSCVSAEPSATPRQQLTRRLRMMEAFLEVLVRRPDLFLTPTRPVALLNAHRTWRVTGGPVCQVVLAGLAARNARRSPVAAAWAALNAFAVADYVVAARRDRDQGGRLRALLAQALGMPPAVTGAAAVGVVRRLSSGGNSGTWTSVQR